VIEELRRKGTAMLPIDADALAVRTYLDRCETHPGPHIRAHGMYSAFKYYRPTDVIKAPTLLDTFNHPMVIEIMAKWLDCCPCLYSVNAWWSLRGFEPQCWHNQEWHVDTDADRFLCLFIYLTDVTSEEDGPQQIEKDSVWSILGRAGTMFVSDTLNRHRGLPPKRRDRLMVWARYGNGPNSNSADLDGVAPIPAREVPTKMKGTVIDQHINRLLVNFGGLGWGRSLLLAWESFYRRQAVRFC
jgi:hypothetical protein